MPSNTISLGLLSLAGSALAFPHPSGRPLSGFPADGFPTAASASGSGVPYPLGNSTGIYLPTSGRSSQDTTQTATETRYNTVTAYSTIEVEAAGATGSAAGAAAGSDDTCATPTVTSTVTNKVYVTVTLGASSEEASPVESAAPSSSSSSSSSISLELVPSSSSVAVNAAAFSYSGWGSSTATSSVPATSAEASPVASSSPVSSAAPSSSEAPASSVASCTTSSAPASSSSSSSGNPGTKRGLAYNDISLLAAFDNTETSWCWNWGQESGGDTDGNMYIPTLWNASDVQGTIGYERTQSWVANAKSAISNGATALFSFNECDLEAQANMSPEEAATQYKKWLSDEFGGQGVTLVAPSVTNGAAPLGLDWMTNFLGNCSSCQVDAVNVHWYDSATNIDYFKQHVTDAHTKSGKSVYVTEFAPTGSDDEISSFLEEVLPWLDSQDFVEKYSYFMVADGILNSGSALSTIGQKYATFTS